MAAVELDEYGDEVGDGFEYQLTRVNAIGDHRRSIGAVRGPLAHAQQVFDARTDPENEGYYGPGIALQRRPIVEWETIAQTPPAPRRSGPAV
jgi:hypothetical protein